MRPRSVQQAGERVGIGGGGAIATVAFLIEATARDVDLGPAVAERLAALGVTNLSLYRDHDALCIVLEGWAFDAGSVPDAASVIGVETRTRTLHPVMQSALRATR